MPTAALPTQTPTLPPAPRTFVETFDKGAPYWDFTQSGNGQALAAPAARDGFLVFDLQAPNQWAYALYAGHDYADVTVEAEAQPRATGDGAAGIVCRYDEHKGWYELNVFSDRTYQLLFGQWLAAGIATYTPLYRGEAEAIQAESNTISLQCQANMLTPFINGHQMRRWQELKFALQKGKIGLVASSFNDVPFSIAFDSVTVTEP